MNKKERKTAAVMTFLRKDEDGNYFGYLQNLKHARICDFPKGIIISLDSELFEIKVLRSDTIKIMFLETGANELFTEGRKFMFPYTVKVNALKEREALLGDIKLGVHEQEFSAHYINYSMRIKCKTLLEAVKLGRGKLEEVKNYLDKAVRDYRPKLKNPLYKLYTLEDYLKLVIHKYL